MSMTLTCSCPPPRRVITLGLFSFTPRDEYVVDRDPYCEIHGDPFAIQELARARLALQEANKIQ